MSMVIKADEYQKTPPCPEKDKIRLTPAQGGGEICAPKLIELANNANNIAAKAADCLKSLINKR